MLRLRFGPVLLAGAMALALVACASDEPGGEGESAMEDESAMEQAVGMDASAPDTTAEGLWSYLEHEDYQNNWALWPGKGELYEGQEPHGALLTTYVNPLALGALTNHAGSMPAGAIVVKENYTPDSSLAAVTVMYKSPGYNARHNDWYWLKRLADGTVEVQGRGTMCISCHGGQSDNDYLFTGSLSR